MKKNSIGVFHFIFKRVYKTKQNQKREKRQMGGGVSSHTEIQYVDPKNVASRCAPCGEGECPICFETVELVQTHCGHKFCANDLNRCHNVCPLCRGRVVDGMTREQVHQVLIENLEAAGFLIGC